MMKKAYDNSKAEYWAKDYKAKSHKIMLIKNNDSFEVI